MTPYFTGPLPASAALSPANPAFSLSSPNSWPPSRVSPRTPLPASWGTHCLACVGCRSRVEESQIGPPHVRSPLSTKSGHLKSPQTHPPHLPKRPILGGPSTNAGVSLSIQVDSWLSFLSSSTPPLTCPFCSVFSCLAVSTLPRPLCLATPSPNSSSRPPGLWSPQAQPSRPGKRPSPTLRRPVF